MEAQDTTYSYTPLDKTTKEIRLLHLHPTNGTSNEPPAPDIIRCTFSLADLDDYSDHRLDVYSDPHLDTLFSSENPSKPFEALSYAWGDAKDRTLIDLDGHAFPVTKTLYSALAHLRLLDEERIIWADALCINQGDTNERENQVAMMQFIYARASRVVVFLGEAFEGCDAAMDMMEMMAEDPHLHYNPTIEPRVVSRGMDFSYEELLSSVAQFYSFPWWSRVWTVQEYALAVGVFVQCGHRKIDGDVLQEYAGNFKSHYLRCCGYTPDIGSSPPPEGLFLISEIYQAMNLVCALNEIRSLSTDLLEVMCDLKYRQCFDPRDRIYGMLGIAQGPLIDTGLIQSDYSRSLKELYELVCVAFLTAYQSLDILSLVSTTPRTVENLPSFVPDWDSFVTSESILSAINRFWLVRGGHYCACPDVPANLHIASNGRGETYGVFFDRISRIGQSQSSFLDHGSFYRDLLGPFYQDWVEVRDDPEFPYISRSTAYWMTLCGGLISQFMTRHVLESDFHMYEKWKAWVESDQFDYSRSPEDLELNDFDTDDFDTSVWKATDGRILAMTEKGYMGLVPENAVVGDQVVLLAGGKVPYVLRLESDGNASSREYKFLGDAYIHGIMQGEAWDKNKVEPIVLI